MGQAGLSVAFITELDTCLLTFHPCAAAAAVSGFRADLAPLVASGR